MRHLFNDLTLATADTDDEEEYTEITNDVPFDLSTPSGRLDGAILVIAAVLHAMEMYDVGMVLCASI